MKPATPKPILLKNYTPPPYLIDTVELDVSLHPTQTRVLSTLKMRPNSHLKKMNQFWNLYQSFLVHRIKTNFFFNF